MSRETALERAAREAWRSLAGGRADPARIELLKRGPRGTAVHRLVFPRAAGPAVIAKRAPLATAEVERIVYERLLHDLPVPTLRYHGSVQDAEAGFRWLFVEEARGSKYRREWRSHRVAAARWLATLHRSLAGIPAVPELPDRRAGHYRRLLRSVREALDRRLGDPALAPDGKAVLEAVLGHCDRLAERWSELEAACEGAPLTLVHGDFVDHNVHVRREASGLVFLPFDWEKAGWGVPAEDISSVDGDAYRDAMGNGASRLEPGAIGRLASAGRIFRCLVFLDWVVFGGAFARLDLEIEPIGLCRSWLDALVEEAAWRS
jgi:aminoglycoside phosphotransferase (APT) family kinase protein